MASNPPSATKPLPPGWREAFDEKRNRWYFYNPETKQSQWHHPGGTNVEKKAAWVEKFDETYRRPYWYNRKTKQSSWTKPADEPIVQPSSSTKRKAEEADLSVVDDDESRKAVTSDLNGEEPRIESDKDAAGDRAISSAQASASPATSRFPRVSSGSTESVLSPVTGRPMRLDERKRISLRGLPRTQYSTSDELLSVDIESSRGNPSASVSSPISMPPKSPHRKRGPDSLRVKLESTHLASSFNTDRDLAFKDGGLFGKQKLAAMQRSSAEDIQVARGFEGENRRHYSSKVPSNESLLEPTSPVEAPVVRVPVGAAQGLIPDDSSTSTQASKPMTMATTAASQPQRVPGRSSAFSSMLNPSGSKKPPVILTSRPAFSSLHQRRMGGGSRSPTSPQNNRSAPDQGTEKMDVSPGEESEEQHPAEAVLETYGAPAASVAVATSTDAAPGLFVDFRRDLGQILMADPNADHNEEEDAGSDREGSETATQRELDSSVDSSDGLFARSSTEMSVRQSDEQLLGVAAVSGAEETRVDAAGDMSESRSGEDGIDDEEAGEEEDDADASAVAVLVEDKANDDATSSGQERTDDKEPETGDNDEEEEIQKEALHASEEERSSDEADGGLDTGKDDDESQSDDGKVQQGEDNQGQGSEESDGESREDVGDTEAIPEEQPTGSDDEEDEEERADSDWTTVQAPSHENSPEELRGREDDNEVVIPLGDEDQSRFSDSVHNEEVDDDEEEQREEESKGSGFQAFNESDNPFDGYTEEATTLEVAEATVQHAPRVLASSEIERDEYDPFRSFEEAQRMERGDDEQAGEQSVQQPTIWDGASAQVVAEDVMQGIDDEAAEAADDTAEQAADAAEETADQAADVEDETTEQAADAAEEIADKAVIAADDKANEAINVADDTANEAVDQEVAEEPETRDKPIFASSRRESINVDHLLVRQQSLKEKMEMLSKRTRPQISFRTSALQSQQTDDVADAENGGGLTRTASAQMLATTSAELIQSTEGAEASPAEPRKRGASRTSSYLDVLKQQEEEKPPLDRSVDVTDDDKEPSPKRPAPFVKSGSVKDMVAKLSSGHGGSGVLPIQFGAPPKQSSGVFNISSSSPASSAATAVQQAPMPPLERRSSVKDIVDQMSSAGDIPFRFGSVPDVSSMSPSQADLENEAHLSRAKIPAGLRREPSRRASNFAGS